MRKNRAHLKFHVNIPRWLRLGSWFAVAAWALGIVVLSSFSGKDVAKMNLFEVSDKVAHFAAYAVGAVLLALALRWNTAWFWPRIVCVSIAAISIFGATDEWHQLYTPHRSGGDLADWIADTLGAITGAAATSFFHARHQLKNRTAPFGA
jgi:VanZ family protein